MPQREYTSFCDECQVVMDRRSSDGTLLYCPHCWVPKPVPLEYLSNLTRVAVVNRLRTLAWEREQEQAA